MRNPVAVFAKAPAPVATRYTSMSPGSLGNPQPTQALLAMETVGTVCAVVGALAESTSMVNWRLYRKTASGDEGDRKEVTDHPAISLLNAPNPHFGRMELFETFQQHVDLLGAGALLVSHTPIGRVPYELWAIRPDRIEPVPDPYDFISGYIYTSPDGEQIPLNVDEVLRLRLPNPRDGYRGLAPLQSVITAADANRFATEWNRNFFINGAQPGGIIKLDRRMSDREFAQMRDRWEEQHRGVARAHRVALLEVGEYIPINYSIRDMQFPELSEVSKTAIREAYRFPLSLLGTMAESNRAAAETAEVTFGRWMLVPRLERIKSMLNRGLLPQYKASANNLEFDYDSPIPDDMATEDARLAARVNSAVALIGTGKFEVESILEAMELPEIEEAEEPEPEPTPEPPPFETSPDDVDDVEEDMDEIVEGPRDPKEGQPAPTSRAHIHRVPSAETGDQDKPQVDLSKLGKAWDDLLATLLTVWDGVTREQRNDLVDQVLKAAEDNDLDALVNLTAPDASGAEKLTKILAAMYAKSLGLVADEAAAQGVTVGLPKIPKDDLERYAEMVAQLIARELELSASRKALIVYSEEMPAARVAAEVGAHLDSLTGASTKTQLGHALTATQNKARVAFYAAAPEAAYYADEQLDSNTCKYCREVDGRWLGNDLDQVHELYSNGGYISCEGGPRCRGTVVAVWRGGQDSTQWEEKGPV